MVISVCVKIVHHLQFLLCQKVRQSNLQDGFVREQPIQYIGNSTGMKYRPVIMIYLRLVQRDVCMKRNLITVQNNQMQAGISRKFIVLMRKKLWMSGVYLLRMWTKENFILWKEMSSMMMTCVNGHGKGVKRRLFSTDTLHMWSMRSLILL